MTRNGSGWLGALLAVTWAGHAHAQGAALPPPTAMPPPVAPAAAPAPGAPDAAPAPAAPPAGSAAPPPTGPPPPYSQQPTGPAYPPAGQSQPPAQQSQAPAAPVPMGTLQLSPPPPPAPLQDDKGVGVLVLRLGVPLTGDGALDENCSGDCAVAGFDSPYEDDSSVMLSADYLFRVGETLRLGPGLRFVPRLEGELKLESVDAEGFISRGRRDFAFGSEYDLDAVVEGAFHLSGKTALVVRGELGAMLLSPSRDFADMRTALEDQCGDATISCSRASSPFLGLTYGGSAGVLVELDHVGLRTELGLQFTRLSYDDEITDEDTSATASLETIFSTQRLWLSFGVEF